MNPKDTTPKKEFFGMKYPFKECARPQLRPLGYSCRDCSVNAFCEAKEKDLNQRRYQSA